tara:strand:+ start:993 stop:2339 length:1347 start_codon:yes stop_codon:yes gene_type:complete
MSDKTMKILFSNPPWWTQKKSARNNKIMLAKGVRAGSRWPFTFICKSSFDKRHFDDYTPFPHFLASAATYLKQYSKHQIFFRDSIALCDSYEKFNKYLKELDADIIVIECQSTSWEHDKKLIKDINNKFENLKVIVVGPVVNNFSEQDLIDFGIYSACKGEYDKNILKAIDQKHKIQDYDLMTIDEMNNSPFPWNDELHYDKYSDNTPVKPMYPMFWMWTSRGCPYRCNFCVWPSSMTNNDPSGTGKRTVRQYSPDYIKDYLTHTKKKYDYKTIFVDDDTFNIGNKHTIEMSKVFGEIGIPWNALVRADTCKNDAWQIMKDNGCYAVRIGFESGNQYIVDHVVNKRLNLKKAAEVVGYLNNIGIISHGTFTIGHLGETKEQMDQTMKYAKSIGLHSYQTAGVGVLDGSPLGNFIKENKMELDENDMVIEKDADTKSRILGYNTTNINN